MIHRKGPAAATRSWHIVRPNPRGPCPSGYGPGDTVWAVPAKGDGAERALQNVTRALLTQDPRMKIWLYKRFHDRCGLARQGHQVGVARIAIAVGLFREIATRAVGERGVDGFVNAVHGDKRHLCAQLFRQVIQVLFVSLG